MYLDRTHTPEKQNNFSGIVMINKWVETFTSTILNLCIRLIPNRKVTIKHLEPKWITNEIKRLIRKRSVYRKAIHSNNHSDMQKFKKLRNNIVVKSFCVNFVRRVSI